MAQLGTRENPITHDGPDRRWKFCKCANCSRIEQCTPMLDFYSQKDRDALWCQRCTLAAHKKDGQAVVMQLRDKPLFVVPPNKAKN